MRAGAPHVVLATSAVDPGAKTQIFGGGEALEYSRAIPAYSAFVADPDGTDRKMPPKTEKGLDFFPYAVAKAQTGDEVERPAGTFIDFPGPPGTIPRLSFADVEAGNFATSAVRDKVVVVGATADALQDFKRTPVGDRMPGAEFQATAISTVLDDFPLHMAGRWVNAILVLLLAAVGPLVALRFGATTGVLAGVVSVLLFLAGAYVAFGQGVVVGVMPPLAAGATAMVGLVVVSTPVDHPRLNWVLDKLSPGSGINRRTRRLRTLMLLTAALVCAGGGLILFAANGLRGLDFTTVDMRFDVRGAREAPDDVVVVAIDDASINTQDRTWPLNRRTHAAVIRNLDEAGAAVIAYDVQFTQESGNVGADNALITAVRRASPRVVLAATSLNEKGETLILRRWRGTEVQPCRSGLLELRG